MQVWGKCMQVYVRGTRHQEDRERLVGRVAAQADCVTALGRIFIWTLFAAGSSRPMNGHSGAAETACTDQLSSA
eukprot:6175723-Prymnesium_polylepis.1